MTFKAVGNGAIQELVYVSAPPPHHRLCSGPHWV